MAKGTGGYCGQRQFEEFMEANVCFTPKSIIFAGESASLGNPRNRRRVN